MKKLLGFAVLLLVAYIAYQAFVPKAPTPEERRARAHADAQDCVRYWLDAIRDKREFDLLGMTHDSARMQSKMAIEHLRRIEDQKKGICDKTSFAPLGSPGAYKAFLSSTKAGALMSVTLRAEKRQEMFWIVEVTID